MFNKGKNYYYLIFCFFGVIIMDGRARGPPPPQPLYAVSVNICYLKVEKQKLIKNRQNRFEKYK